MTNRQPTEMQRKNMEVAMRLVQLTVENSMQIMAAIAALADALCRQSFAIARRQADTEDANEIVRLNADYRQQTTQTVMNSARKIAEIGNDMRIRFAHLLTEQLASGDEELLDAFQSFFAVLPARSPAVIVPAYPVVKAATTGFDRIRYPSGNACDDIGDLPAGRFPAEDAWQPRGASRAF
jgi:hypothetical protein